MIPISPTNSANVRENPGSLFLFRLLFSSSSSCCKCCVCRIAESLSSFSRCKEELLPGLPLGFVSVSSSAFPGAAAAYTTLSLHSSIAFPLSLLKVSAGSSSRSVCGGTTALCRRNLSLHCISGGYSRWAWRVTLIMHESQGCITPVLGRTKYFLGEVVLTLNAT